MEPRVWLVIIALGMAGLGVTAALAQIPFGSAVGAGVASIIAGTNVSVAGSPNVTVSVTPAITAATSVTTPSVIIGTTLAFSSTAPTVSGFGTSPSVPAGRSAAFTIDVGTGGTASTGTITFPAATTGWIVSCYDVTTPASFVTSQTGGTTTTATVTNYSRTTGLATAWTASDILRCTGTAY